MISVKFRFMTSRIDVVIPPLSQAFTYELPPQFSAQVNVGSRIVVPLGRRQATGFVVARSDDVTKKLPYALKAVDKPGELFSCFMPQQLKFFEWIADYYAEPLANVIDTAIPSPVPKRFSKTVCLLKAQPLPARSKIAPKIIAALQSAGGRADYGLLAKQIKGCAGALKKLEEAGLISVHTEEMALQQPFTTAVPEWAPTELQLNPAQQAALEALAGMTAERKFHPSLLHGITGSGKTEVYIEAIARCLERGEGSLVIVPEIALTPQLVDRFRARLGDQIALLHSSLNPRVRWESWRRLVEGQALIAIGTRSGVFAPVPNLRLIIVDEEHDPSFKQNDGLRYNARDLALVRGMLEKCSVVLGSATPSLETLQNALSGKFRYLTLPSRPQGSSVPAFTLVDMNRSRLYQRPSQNISSELYQGLIETLERRQQAFVLYNRRGFASYLQCEECEFVIECPNCSVTMTYHNSTNALLCHYCNMHIVPPEFCPNCNKPGSKSAATKPAKLVQRGAGTEKIYDELRELFPDAVIDRLDRDSATQHDQYRAILDRVRSGETQILVGTQMIAKGHDLPGVTLVGVADCDVGLHMPDFRAAERVFQILTQASGRAGRAAAPGKVVLQTRVPQHPSLVRTKLSDFSGFSEVELRARKLLNYPPYCKLLRVVAASVREHEPLEALTKLRRYAARLIEAKQFAIQVLGPAPAPIEKIKAQWRAHLLFKAKGSPQLNVLLKTLKGLPNKSASLKLIFDVDPQDML